MLIFVVLLELTLNYKKMETIVSKVAPICKLKDIIDKNKVNGSLFVAGGKNGNLDSKLVYADNGFNNSDRVRQAFAKRNGMKFTDVRCCRLKNS